MKLLIIIPTFNEASNIEILIQQIQKYMKNFHYDILVVDDSSIDGTVAIVKEIASHNSIKISIIERTGERGLGRSYREGLAYGLKQDYDAFVTMDADLSHHPKYLPQMIDRLATCELVIGCRYIKNGGTVNWRIRRILLSWLANRFSRLILGLKSNDLTSGYRIYKRQSLESINLERICSEGYSFLVELLYYLQKNNARLGEIPIIFHDRIMGVSKISKKEIFKGALTIFRIRLKNPHDIYKKQPSSKNND